MATNQVDYSPQLQQLMQRVGIGSYRQLSETAGVSRWTINQLRQGNVARLRIEGLTRLSQALAVSWPDLLHHFAAVEPTDLPGPETSEDVQALRREYHRLQQQLADQEAVVRQRVQGEAIAILESWLLQWPTATHAVQQNATLPAARLLPLTKPLEALLKAWQVEPIGDVGETQPFDPQIHQPMAGNPQVGQMVRIRYVGYRHGQRLLYRAKVSPADG